MTELHNRSRRQEQRTAGLVGGSVVPRSGAGWRHKADVRSGKHLIENKRTDNKRSITIKAEDLEKIRRQATQKGLDPVLSFELAGRDYAIISMSHFVELTSED